MNQILVSNSNEGIEKDVKKTGKKNFFKFQMFFSILLIVILFIKTLLENYNKYKLEKISEDLNKNLRVSSLYNVKNISKEEELYLGKIMIPKINLEYLVFNKFSEELLEISPCKFYGSDIGEEGNICIAGHNYNDNRFFGKLFEIEKNDIIKLVDMSNNTYLYRVYDIYETSEKDLSCLDSIKEYELTLVTCNNTNKKRRIIKAVYNEFFE